MGILDLFLILIFLFILIILFLWVFLHIRILEILFKQWSFLAQKKFLYILVIVEIVLTFVIYQRLWGGGGRFAIPALQGGAGLTADGTSQIQSMGDYAKDVENCNALLYKSPSNSIYCYIAINAELGDGVGVKGAGVSYEPTMKRAQTLFEQRYQATLKSFRDQEESAGSQPGWEKGVVTEESAPGGVKLILNKHANIKTGNGFLYDFSGEVHVQQGTCVLEISGDALTRAQKSDGDLSRLKEVLFRYTDKVIGDFSKYCQSEENK